MAEYTQGYAETRAPLEAGKLLNLAGALVSLGLIVGIGVWGYKLVARDVSGVPVVQALEGPMRISPDNPGGEIASNMGLAVNEVAAEGGASAPEEAEIVVLAPPVVELSQEDLSVLPSVEANEGAQLGADAQDQAAQTGAVDAVMTPAPAPGEALTADQILALADQIATGATIIEPVEAAIEAQPVKTAVNGVPSEVIADIVPSSVAGVSSSPRPISRPENLSLVRVPAPDTSIPSDATVTTTALPVGTNLVQLGAYESPEVAASEWVRFNTRFSDFLAGKERVIQRAERGGRTFFRLRAMGFSEIADARRLCAALIAEGTDCVPVVVR